MSERQIATTHFVASLLVLWICAVGAVLVLFDTADSSLVVLALVAAIVVVGMARPFRGAGKLAAALAILYYLGLQAYRVMQSDQQLLQIDSSFWLLVYSPQLARFWPAAVLVVVCLAAIGVLVDALTRRLSELGRQLVQNAAAVEELTQRDRLTGVIKGLYADRLLTQEIERARRYKRLLTIALLAADDWPQTAKDRGLSGSAQLLKSVGDVLSRDVRVVDTVARGEESHFIVIMPETPLDGAHGVAERLCLTVAAKTSITYRAGIVEFPTDAVSKNELMAEATAALELRGWQE